MIVLLDTNIIMDALQERSPYDKFAKKILLSGQKKEITCLFTANAATDIFYLYSKARDTSSAKVALNFLLKTYSVIGVSHEDCINALNLHIEDFEDALVVTCAKKTNVDYIITRDEKFLSADLTIETISPKNFIDIMELNLSSSK